jgi:hypothetical protein
MPNYVTVAQKEVKLSADRISTRATFDVVLSKPDSGTPGVTRMGMYKLTIKLRVRLEPSARVFPVVNDASEPPKAFAIRPWSGTEWQTFVNGAKAQANLWNNRFWLVPPPTVKDYDYTHIDAASRFKVVHRRPYFACELEVDFNAGQADAHRIIEVYNLDVAKITGKKNSGTFRSDAMHYDSLDTTPWITNYLNSDGKTMMYYYTIAHEIGHAIGQPHIGVMRKTPLCELEMNLADMGYGGEGQNSDSCYAGDNPSLGRNVMGGGSAFTEDNAISWLWCIRFLRGNPSETWQVLTSKPSTEEALVSY